MIILAFDTALAACSAALYDSAGDKVVAARRLPLARGHAEALPGMIAAVVAESGMALSAVDRIAVTRGPGTFTGVRIGLATARGLALALARPAVGISTLEAIAANVSLEAGERVACVIDARRGEVYRQVFEADGTALAAPRLMAVADAARLVPEGAWLAGTGAPLLVAAGCRGRLAPAADMPEAAVFARRAARLDPEAAPPEPLYLRAADAKPQAAAVAISAGAPTVVAAGPAEAAVMAALNASAFAQPWSATEIAALLASPGSVARLALVDDSGAAPAGFAIARRAADEAEILTLCTRPAARRRGVGRALVQSLVEALACEGVTSLFLEVGKDNLAAVRLYRSLGFGTVGRRPGYYGGAETGSGDALVMRRGLGGR